MMSPLGNFMDFGTRPFSSDVGTTMMSWETIGGDNRAAISGRKIQNAIHHDRRGFRFVFWARAEIIGSPDPRNLEVLDIVPINRIQGRIPRAAGIATIDTPFSILRALLRDDG